MQRRVLSHDVPQSHSPPRTPVDKLLSYGAGDARDDDTAAARANGNGNGCTVQVYAPGSSGGLSDEEEAEGEGDAGLPMPEPFKIKSEHWFCGWCLVLRCQAEPWF
jgi:hypothetical protein